MPGPRTPTAPSTTSPDRRVRRTHRQLRAALVALTLERGWDAVSVLDVCARADVGRSTFYVHFADKEDLLLSGFDDLHASLDDLRRRRDGDFGFVAPLAAHAAQHRDLMRAVAGRQSGQRVHGRFHDVVASLIDAELAALKVARPGRATLTAFLAGGLVALLLGWLDQAGKAGKVTPDDLAARFRSLALATVRAG